MIITNETTTHQIAECMGDEADDLDGRIMLGLLARECESDTDAIPSAKWEALLEESQRIRRTQYEQDSE